MQGIKSQRVLPEDNPLNKKILDNMFQYHTRPKPPTLNEKLQFLSQTNLITQPQISHEHHPSDLIPRVAPTCPYYGLYKMRERQQKGINDELRNDYILRSLALK